MNTKTGRKKRAQQPDSVTAAPVLHHAMRNGTLYRSQDGVNWEVETDPEAPALQEGTSKSVPHRLKNKK
jgi:hypothetical protein